MAAVTIDVRRVDYGEPGDALALVQLLDGYASDAAGGGQPLAAQVLQGLPAALQQRPRPSA